MHKHIGSFVVLSLLAILFIMPGIFDAIFSLLFVGVIPRTNITIPADVLMAIDALLLALTLYAMIRLLVTAGSTVKRDVIARERARKKILKRTNQSKTQAMRPKKRYMPVTEQ